jgi:hypothetical protein
MSFLTEPSPFEFFDHLNKDVPDHIKEAISEYMLRNPRSNVLPFMHLHSHTPVSVAAEGMIPTYRSRSALTGELLNARTFPTRTPNRNTAVLFNHFKRISDVELLPGEVRSPSGELSSGKLFIRGDRGAIFPRLTSRLVTYLSRDPLALEHLHRSTTRQKLIKHEVDLLTGGTEVGIQAKSWLWDGPFINDFLADPSVFAPLAPSEPPQASTYGLHPALQWGAQTAIGDLLLLDPVHKVCAASWEEKPKFHVSRMRDIAGTAATVMVAESAYIEGFYIEMRSNSHYTCSLPLSKIVQSEQHVYIQVSERAEAKHCDSRMLSFVAGSRAVLRLRHTILHYQRFRGSSVGLPRQTQPSSCVQSHPI